MPKAKPNIVFAIIKVGKQNLLRRYLDFVHDGEKLNAEKSPMYLRAHQLCMKVESAQGNIFIWVSRKFDTDRQKAAELLKALMKEFKIVGEIVEYKPITALSPKEYNLLQNPDSLAELSKPISFKNDEVLTAYAQGVLLILSKLKRMVLVNTPETRNELKILQKMLNSVANEIK